jgi:hypothetical protein
MTEHPLTPQLAYEALAEAGLSFQLQEAEPTAQRITALQEAVMRVTEVWQRCEPVRAAREEEFRYHVVKLKLLLASAAQTLDAVSGLPLSQAA